VSKLQIPTKDTLKRIQRFQTLTIAWMSDEAALSLWAVWTAGSPALVAFSGDRAADLFSALVGTWRFTDGRLPENLQCRAMRRSDSSPASEREGSNQIKPLTESCESPNEFDVHIEPVSFEMPAKVESAPETQAPDKAE